MLVDRKKRATRMIKEDSLGSISVVDIKIVNRDFFDAVGQGFQRRNRNLVQITKAHRTLALRMMSRRANQTEGRLTLSRQSERLQGRANGTFGMFPDFWISGCISVEIPRLTDSFQMVRAVSAEKNGSLNRSGLSP